MKKRLLLISVLLLGLSSLSFAATDVVTNQILVNGTGEPPATTPVDSGTTILPITTDPIPGGVPDDFVRTPIEIPEDVEDEISDVIDEDLDEEPVEGEEPSIGEDVIEIIEDLVLPFTPITPITGVEEFRVSQVVLAGVDVVYSAAPEPVWWTWLLVINMGLVLLMVLINVWPMRKKGA